MKNALFLAFIPWGKIQRTVLGEAVAATREQKDLACRRAVGLCNLPPPSETQKAAKGEKEERRSWLDGTAKERAQCVQKKGWKVGDGHQEMGRGDDGQQEMMGSRR